jgi:hypothetical protein
MKHFKLSSILIIVFSFAGISVLGISCGLLFNNENGSGWIDITPTSVNVNTGQTFQLKAFIHRENGSYTDVTGSALWSTSDPSLAVVVGQGRIMAIQSCDASGVYVGAQVSGLSGSAKMVVTDAGPAIGAAWFIPNLITKPPGSSFDVEIHVNTGSKKLSSFAIEVDFDQALVSVSSSGVIPGGYNNFTVTPYSNSVILVGSFPPGAEPSGTDLSLLHIYWITQPIAGQCTLQMPLVNLTDPASLQIGTPTAYGCTVNIAP